MSGLPGLFDPSQSGFKQSRKQGSGRNRGTGLPDVLQVQRSLRIKRSIYKLLKYRTKNSHIKYKSQAIIEVIK